jgi:uncharacterized protein YjlB
MRPEKIEFIDGMPVTIFVRSVEHYPYHWHDTLEILQVLKGTVNIGIGDEELLLRENDIAVINVGELHRIIESREDNEILFVQIASFPMRACKLCRNAGSLTSMRVELTSPLC